MTTVPGGHRSRGAAEGEGGSVWGLGVEGTGLPDSVQQSGKTRSSTAPVPIPGNKSPWRKRWGRGT